MGIFSTKRVIMVVLLVGIASAVAYKYSFGTSAPSTSSTQAQGQGGGRGGNGNTGVAPVMVADVERKSMPVSVAGIGNVEAFTAVQIKPRVDGQIMEVDFKEGQEVKKGEVLFKIDPRPYVAAVHSAEAAVARDRASADRAAAQEQRQKELLNQHFVSNDAYAQFVTNGQTAVAVAKASDAALENARLQLDYATVTSPITGYVGKMMLQLGSVVRAADVNPIALINQVHPIYVTFAVPEQRLAEIRRSMKAGPLTVEAVPSDSAGKVSTGKLVFIDNAVDQSTGTIKLRAQFENLDNALWPGQFANVSVKLFDDAGAVVIPGTALQTGPNGQFVFVVKPDMTAEVRPVKIARNDGDAAIVSEGLKGGERVVIQGQLRLVQGTKVSILQQPNGPAAAQGAGGPAAPGAEKSTAQGAEKPAEQASDKVAAQSGGN